MKKEDSHSDKYVSRKKFEDYVRIASCHYISVLLLENYIFDVEYSDTVTYLECCVNRPYLDYVIRYSDAVVEEYEKGTKTEDIRRAIIHELCHVITAQFRHLATHRNARLEEIEDEWEKMTDHIANIIFKQNL